MASILPKIEKRGSVDENKEGARRRAKDFKVKDLNKDIDFKEWDNDIERTPESTIRLENRRIVREQKKEKFLKKTQEIIA